MSQRYIFDAIGTHWVIECLISQEVYEKIRIRIDEFDRAYSRFRDDSLVSAVSRQPGTYIFPADSVELFRVYRDMYDATDGMMTPLIGQVLVDAGYDAEYTLIQKNVLEKPEEWDTCMLYEYPSLIVKKSVLLDFGAAGKGYLVDIIGELLEVHGVLNYTIDAGGDIRYRNTMEETLAVALEHPGDTTQAIGLVHLAGGVSICGSAGNRRAWQGFHHIISPMTLQSPNNILAVWVTSATTIVADALTTALFFVSPAVLIERFKNMKKEYTFEYLIVYADYSYTVSEAFPAELFL